MITISGLLSHFLQGYILADQILGDLQPSFRHKLVKCGTGFFLKQLRHGGNTDTATVSHQLQGKLLRQINIHIGCDLIQKRFPFLAGAGAFLTAL